MGKDALTPRKVREFGAVMAAACAVAAGWGAWRDGFAMEAWRWGLLGAAALLAVVTIAAPGLLAWPCRAWLALGRLLGRVTTPIVLSAFWLVVIVPIGLVRRVAGADPLGRRRRPDGESYWRPVEDDGRGRERYEQMF